MKCAGCEYELTGLAATCCPECGRAFDPDDASTYISSHDSIRRRRQIKWLERALIGAGMMPVLANVFGFLALLIARVSLGRWPHRGGMDDPKNVPGVDPVGIIALLLVIASLPAFVMGIIFLIGLMTHQAWQRAMKAGAIALVLWVTGFILARWDPAGVWMWLFD